MLGLGDHKIDEDRFPDPLKIWGLNGEMFKFLWHENQPFLLKLNKLLSRIDKLSAEGKTVSLVGISAGASGALNAYVRRKDKINRVIFVCGRLGQFELINPSYFMRNPVFKESLSHVSESLEDLGTMDKQKMLSMQPLHDGLVPPSSTKISGVENKRIFCIGHVASIFAAFLLHGRSITKFIKSG